MRAFHHPLRSKSRPPALLRWPLCALALTASASCVPTAQERQAFRLDVPVHFSAGLVSPAVAAEAARPAAAGLAGPGPSDAFRGDTSIDRLRAADCLAQAIYYEAASESEAGRRAVAQVVLNRVRHPAWPNSVCGVVYQGPMRAGGGCQFTFTCDGALARRPGGSAWAQARRLAHEALAGIRFEPAGLSTHYHTHAVSPSWAPRLQPTIVIGSHRFYALPGAAAPAFQVAYRGSEPLPRPVQTIFRPAGGLRFEPMSAPTTDAAALSLSYAPAAVAESSPEEKLPESTIREEYRQSGQWRADAPAALTGR